MSFPEIGLAHTPEICQQGLIGFPACNRLIGLFSDRLDRS